VTAYCWVSTIVWNVKVSLLFRRGPLFAVLWLFSPLS